MNCRQIEDYMMKYFDRESNDIENAQLKQHLKSCNACNEMFVQMEETFSLLKSDDFLEIPTDFEASVMKKVDDLESTRKVKRSRLLMLVYNAAAIISVVLLMLFVAYSKETDFPETLAKIKEYAASFTTIAAGVLDMCRDMLGLAVQIGEVLFRASALIVEKYSLVLFTFFAALLALQKAAHVIVHQDRRGNG